MRLIDRLQQTGEAAGSWQGECLPKASAENAARILRQRCPPLDHRLVHVASLTQIRSICDRVRRGCSKVVRKFDAMSTPELERDVHFQRSIMSAFHPFRTLAA